MIDLFNFLKDLVRNGADVIAAFVMGVVVATVFLASVIYWFLNRFYAKKIVELEEQVKDAEAELSEAEKHKRKAKERKGAIAEQERVIGELQVAVARADQAAAEEKHKEEAARLALQDAQAKATAKDAAARKQFSDLAEKYNRLGKVATYWKKQAASLNEQAKLFERMQGQLWDLPVEADKIAPFRPLKRHAAVIIALINLKGGVGKTTLTANLAATYCHHLDKRVLVVDLDFQASLTGLCLSADVFDERKVGVDEILSAPTGDVAKLAFSNTVRTHEPRMRVLSPSENLANVEERAKASWLMNPGEADLRSVFRSVLHDPVFQESFDVILIDCPPRWTTASINAIACCDYVLIPTVLDRVSAEAVPRLLAWLRNLKASSTELYGHFAVLGVLGNLAFNREVLIEQEKAIWEQSAPKCTNAWLGPVHHFDTIIRDKSEFRRAANNREFAALRPALQPTFVKLVDEIEARRAIHEGR